MGSHVGTGRPDADAAAPNTSRYQYDIEMQENARIGRRDFSSLKFEFDRNCEYEELSFNSILVLLRMRKGE